MRTVQQLLPLLDYLIPLLLLIVIYDGVGTHDSVGMNDETIKMDGVYVG